MMALWGNGDTELWEGVGWGYSRFCRRLRGLTGVSGRGDIGQL